MSYWTLNSGNRQQWRSQVAYITQDVFLFHDSVKENLTWVCDEIKKPIAEQKMWQALKLAAAEDFVKRLPNGLDILIGDRGVKLSGGERQRLALAKALLSEPKILILDEATNVLDQSNELKIRDAIVKLDSQLTIIIIAHNQTTIEHVAQRIEINVN